jgi:hypothetical protein
MSPHTTVDIPVLSLSDEAPGVVPSSTHECTPNVSPSTNQPSLEGEEQALESHEVIELQSFSERKAWIEEKIKVNPSIIRVLQVTHSYLVS